MTDQNNAPVDIADRLDRIERGLTTLIELLADYIDQDIAAIEFHSAGELNLDNEGTSH